MTMTLTHSLLMELMYSIANTDTDHSCVQAAHGEPFSDIVIYEDHSVEASDPWDTFHRLPFNEPS